MDPIQPEIKNKLDNSPSADDSISQAPLTANAISQNGMD
jgi:hypothetical protein